MEITKKVGCGIHYPEDFPFWQKIDKMKIQKSTHKKLRVGLDSSFGFNKILFITEVTETGFEGIYQANDNFYLVKSWS